MFFPGVSFDIPSRHFRGNFVSLRDRVLKSGVKLGIGQAFSQGCSFIRNIILARLISTADFGIASTFAITLSLIEMVSNLAAEKLIIQSKRGDEERFQSTVQFTQFLRGCFSGLVLFIIASPVSSLFGIPEAGWAFRWLAFIPFVRGFIHQDIYRYQRSMKFTPSIIVESTAIGISTIAAYPLGVYFRDYRCMLVVVIMQSIIAIIMSHAISERKYRWAFDKLSVEELYRFGWPLLINGLLLFGILQGDRFVIGSANKLFGKHIYTMSDLGLYSVVFALTFAPTMLITNISTPLFLPLLSKAQTDRDVFEKRYNMVCQIIILAGGGIAILLATSGTYLVKIFYGARYAFNSGSVIAWLGAMQAFRIIRTGPTLAAMAKADTKNSMYSNMVRSVSLLAALLTAASGQNLSWIAASGFFGEFFALIFCLWRLQRQHQIDPSTCAKFATITMSCMLFGYVVQAMTSPGLLVSLTISLGFLSLCFVSTIILFPELRNNLLSIREIVVRKSA